MNTMTMQEATRQSAASATARYAKCIEVSKRVRWDIERDVIRGRRFDFGQKFLPDGLSRVGDLRVPAAGRGALHVAGPGPRPTPTCSRWSSASSARRRSS